MSRIGIAALAVLLVTGGARADGTEQLLEILALHEKLATEEAFQQQAKLLGAYVEAAQSMADDQRALVYQRVLGILRQIEKTVDPPAPPPAPPSPPPAGHTPGGSLDAGAARLEWYKAESLDALPEVPVKKELWTHDLSAMGEDLPPAPDSATTVRISFYFEAKAPGAHEFSAQHGENELRVVVGGKQLVDLKAPGEGGGKGVVHLEGGFHRVDVLLRYEADPSFTVSVLSPYAAESRVVKRSELLLKRPAE